MTSWISKLTIQAASELAVSNNDGSVSELGNSFTAWNEQSPTANVEGVSGSLTPIIFKMPRKKADTFDLSTLQITGTLMYPKDFPQRGPVMFQLVGSLKGAAASEMPKITSRPWPVVLNTQPIDQPGLLLAEGFTMPAPIKSQACPVPFRFAGDFEWQIASVPPNLGCTSCLTKDVSVTNFSDKIPVYQFQTRLEFAWLLGPAPAGPTARKISIERTAADLGGTYPIDLLRLYCPSPVDLLDLAIKLSAGTDYRDWWISQAAARIPTVNFQYNTISGKSGFGVGCCGGSFSLKEYTKLALSGPPTPVLVNSFDLAALIQLAYNLLNNVDGSEVLYTRWICKIPFGKMKPGIPFGLTDKTAPPVSASGVNNPYFWGTYGSNAFESNVAKRADCNVRSWIEAAFEKVTAKVIDISWPALGSPGNSARDLHTRERKVFAGALIDGTVSDESIFDNNEAISTDTAQCFSNDDYGKQSGKPDEIARIGVYNVKGILEPRRGIIAAPLVPVPKSLRKQLDALIVQGRNATPQRWAYNDASLRSHSLLPVLLRTTSFKTDASMTFRLVPGACQISWTLSRDTAQPPFPLDTVVVNVTVFETFHDAYEALIFELTKYECNISTTAQPINDLGNYALQTPHSILCVRGNLFVEITALNINRLDSSGSKILRDMMTRLDAYLGRRGVSKIQVRRPSLALDTTASPPANITVGDVFVAKIRPHESLAPNLMAAQTSRGQLVVPIKFIPADLTYRFMATDRVDLMKYPTDVAISAAHFDTFYPATCTFSVTVGDKP